MQIIDLYLFDETFLKQFHSLVTNGALTQRRLALFPTWALRTCFPSSVYHVSLLSLFTSIGFPVADWEAILDEKKYWRCLIYAPYVFVFESELLFNNTPGPLFPTAEE